MIMIIVNKSLLLLEEIFGGIFGMAMRTSIDYIVLPELCLCAGDSFILR